MTRALTAVVVLCLAVPAIAQQTSTAPSPTPAQHTTPSAGRSRGTPRTSATPTSQPATQSPAQAPNQTGTPAPLGNSKIEIIGDPQHPGKPSDDKPMLPIASVPNPLGLRSGTPICIQLASTADSGHLRNGDTVKAILQQPLAGLAKGTPVILTVVQAARAGSLVSYGELSLQVTQIGAHEVLSDIVTALGKEGKKDIADAAPATGTEAEFPAGQDFTFPVA